jgi:hypothetical protein
VLLLGVILPIVMAVFFSSVAANFNADVNAFESCL